MIIHATGERCRKEAIMAQACKVFGQGRRQIKCRGSWGVEIAKKVSYFRRNRFVCSSFHLKTPLRSKRMLVRFKSVGILIFVGGSRRASHSVAVTAS